MEFPGPLEKGASVEEREEEGGEGEMEPGWCSEGFLKFLASLEKRGNIINIAEDEVGPLFLSICPLALWAIKGKRNP